MCLVFAIIITIRYLSLHSNTAIAPRSLCGIVINYLAMLLIGAAFLVRTLLRATEESALKGRRSSIEDCTINAIQLAI